MKRITLSLATLALVTAFGLVAALVSDDAGDMLAWLSLAYVCYVGIRHALGRKHKARSEPG